MGVDKISISLDAGLGAAVRQAAQRADKGLSAWLAPKRRGRSCARKRSERSSTPGSGNTAHSPSRNCAAPRPNWDSSPKPFPMSALALDAGALVAVDHGERAMIASLRRRGPRSRRSGHRRPPLQAGRRPGGRGRHSGRSALAHRPDAARPGRLRGLPEHPPGGCPQAGREPSRPHMVEMKLPASSPVSGPLRLDVGGHHEVPNDGILTGRQRSGVGSNLGLSFGVGARRTDRSRLRAATDRDFPELTGADLIEGRANLIGVQAHVRPCGGQQHHDRQPPAGEVLLVAHVLIGGDEDVIALVFSPGNQLSIAQFRPPSLPHGVDRMVAEMAPKRRGRALIEQDPHD